MAEQNNNHHNELLIVFNDHDNDITNGRLPVRVRPRPLQEASLPTTQQVTPRRNRASRILLYKRLHKRYSRELAPRLMVAALIFLVVLFSLVSTGVGGAYAYYRTQLPLLNGVADHSLFQSTHIYDRNGQLLYE